MVGSVTPGKFKNSTISKVPTFLVVTNNGTIVRITNGATIFETLIQSSNAAKEWRHHL